MIQTKALPVYQTSYWLHRKDIFDSMPADSNSIVFAGDSHIEHFALTEVFHSLQIKNRGINYDTSNGLLKRVDELAKDQPAQLFIEIGTNDLTLHIAADSIIHNLEQILQRMQIKSPNSRIYLQSVIPNHFNLPERSVLNNKIKQLAFMHHASFIDLDPSFLDGGLKKQYDSGDGVHLNGAGYLKWKAILLPYMNLSANKPY